MAADDFSRLLDPYVDDATAPRAGEVGRVMRDAYLGRKAAGGTIDGLFTEVTTEATVQLIDAVAKLEQRVAELERNPC